MMEQFDIADLIGRTYENSMSLDIYLGGPITPKNPSYSVKWREEFQELLHRLNSDTKLGFLNPLEGLYEGNNFDIGPHNKWRCSNEYLLDNRLHLMMSSSILVFNFLESENSKNLGEGWELGFAFALKNKYIILVDNPEGEARSDPRLLLSATLVADNLYEAAQYCLYLEQKQTR